MNDDFAKALKAFDEGRLDAAEAACRALLARSSSHTAAWMLLGLALLGLKRPEEAAGAFGRTIEAAPMAWSAFHNRAVALAALDRLDDARGCLLQAAVLHPAAQPIRPRPRWEAGSDGSFRFDPGPPPSDEALRAASPTIPTFVS